MILLEFLKFILKNIIQFSSYEIVWSAASAIGTIGAVVFSVVLVVRENKYQTKYKLKIKVSSQMGVLSILEKNLFTELTKLSFEIINKTNRILDNYSLSLELKPTYKNTLVSPSQENVEMPILGQYELITDPFLLRDIKIIDTMFNYQSISPSTPLTIFFDLRENSCENDNIGWTIKSFIELGLFSGKIRIKLIDKFGNYYYSPWHKMSSPKKYKKKKFKFTKQRKVKKLLSRFLITIYKNKKEAYYKEYQRRRNSRK